MKKRGLSQEDWRALSIDTGESRLADAFPGTIACSAKGPSAGADPVFTVTARRVIVRENAFDAYRFVADGGRAEDYRVIWTLPAGFRECLHIYKGAAVGFPLAKEKEEFLSLYHREADPSDIRIRPAFAGRVDHTWHDIKGYGNAIAFRDASGLVMAFYHRGATQRRRLDVLNNKGRHFAFCLETRAPSGDDEAYAFVLYRSEEEKFWWQPALEYADATGIPQNLFRVAVDRLTDTRAPELIILGQDAEDIEVSVRRRGLLDSPWETLVASASSPASSPQFSTPWEKRPSGVYEFRVSAPNATRHTLFIRKPRPRERADILYAFATNAWRSYATNGHYHGPIDHCFPWSYSYSATIMEGVSDIYDDVQSSYRYPPQPEYYNNMPNGYARLSDGFVNSLEFYAAANGLSWRACGEEDIDDGSVRLENYRLVLLDNHAEYSTPNELDAFERYLKNGGALIVTGGDAFGRRVDYIRDKKGRVRYQKLFRNTVLGLGVKPDAQGRFHRADYPLSAQYSDKQRLDRFGLCYKCSPPMRDKPLLTVVDNAHPITRRYRFRETISESRWEGDYVNPDWRVLVTIAGRNAPDAPQCAALAVHPQWKLCCLGPMGLNETLAGYYGDKARAHELFSAVLDHFLDGNITTTKE